MKNEEVIIEMLKQISQRQVSMEQRQAADKKEMMDRQAADKKEMMDRFTIMEQRQAADKKEMMDRFTIMEQRQAADKKEIMDRISSFESNTNLHFTNISNTLAHERNRLDAVYDSREQVKVTWSNRIMATNTVFAGIVAFIVSSFK